MHALWVSLKDNVKCGNKLSDVVMQTEKENVNRHICPPKESQASLRVATPPAQLHELSIGDPSRKIVEMIFHKAWVNHTSKPLKKVRSVFRVSNTAEVLERFEKYREKVKKKACEQYPRHPRSIVDGNELLRFYGTTMRCSSKEKSVQQVKDLCRDPSCYVCQIVRFNSGEEFCEGNMIPPNTTTRKDLRVSEMATTRVKNERRAIIVCRIIAGAATHEVDGQPEGSDSTHSGEMQLSLEQFVVRNPSAILPCFVIVHN